MLLVVLGVQEEQAPSRGSGGCLDPDCEAPVRPGSKWCHLHHTNSSNLKTNYSAAGRIAEYDLMNKAKNPMPLIEKVRETTLLNQGREHNAVSVRIDLATVTSAITAQQGAFQGTEFRWVCFVEYKNKMHRKLSWDEEQSWAHWCRMSQDTSIDRDMGGLCEGYEFRMWISLKGAYTRAEQGITSKGTLARQDVVPEGANHTDMMARALEAGSQGFGSSLFAHMGLGGAYAQGLAPNAQASAHAVAANASSHLDRLLPLGPNEPRPLLRIAQPTLSRSKHGQRGLPPPAAFAGGSVRPVIAMGPRHQHDAGAAPHVGTLGGGLRPPPAPTPRPLPPAFLHSSSFADSSDGFPTEVKEEDVEIDGESLGAVEGKGTFVKGEEAEAEAGVVAHAQVSNVKPKNKGRGRGGKDRMDKSKVISIIRSEEVKALKACNDAYDKLHKSLQTALRQMRLAGGASSQIVNKARPDLILRLQLGAWVFGPRLRLWRGG